MFYLGMKYPNYQQSFLTYKEKIYKNLIDYDTIFDFLDCHVKTHCLEEGLIDFLTQYCQGFIRNDFKEIINHLSQQTTNTSSVGKQRILYTQFYTEKMKSIVADWDRLIIHKGGFSFNPKEDLMHKFSARISE